MNHQTEENERKENVLIANKETQSPNAQHTMSDNIHLESLPNEIFVEIFDYLSLHELYQSFKELNQRLNHILQSLNNRAVRLWSTNARDENDMYRFFSSTIVSVDIHDEYDVDLNQFPRLHSLTYTYATNNQLEHFLQTTCCHQHLRYLNVTSDDLSLLVNYFYLNRFPSLRQCILRNIDSILTCPWRITPSLSSIAACDDENLIPFILKSCSKLTRLSLAIFQYSNTSSSSFLVHPHLKHLSIEMIQPAWTVEAIETLFLSVQLPNLVAFRILSYQPSLINFNFVQLVAIIHVRLPHLQRFECDILISKEVETMDLTTIRNLHSFLFNHLKFEYQLDGTLRIYN